MHKVRAKHGDVVLESRQHGLTDTQSLYRFLVGSGEKVLVVRRGRAENVAKKMGKRETHGSNPFQFQPAWRWMGCGCG
jgi:hypothetical protein